MSSPAATRLPLGRMRQATARAMTASALVPQFVLEADIDASSLLAQRAQVRQAGDASLQDFLLAVVARTLQEHPTLNASFDEDAVVLHPGVHLGLAIATDHGLAAPCVFDADRLSVEELAAARRDLQARAVIRRLRREEVAGATFTVSNLGPFGVTRFTPLVTPPQAAVLGVGAVREESGTPRLALTLACDHRALDGADGARFLHSLRSRLESPDTGSSDDR